ncbi:glycosyltransferase family 2 protein [Mumia sp. zg.B53]|uniref:glycosyltransferase family 2 protein n=1 Tax=Mumia sp. zg.B53 TaxID=2855449 RepID=UPI001C6E280B|nr:glycosyltransferase family 2 protein [Mumia sp. zg.B53]MBW9214095.1 glycosyltransferase family 2 protein [Mumia sp. zg.B53]
MSIDVSVVVPTYNTGAKLDALLASLEAQTLPTDRFEVVVVDDGSTDGTWARLQERSAVTPNLRVDRIANSGWPGRPRNLGTDLARGRFVFYSDHDDELFPEALTRMVELGDRAGADVVIGKEVRSGAPTIGAEAFFADRERADLFDDDVLAILTPHKLFRTAFLREHGIRFPEGRRRLEDHVFLAEVYTRTDRISVLASYPCYRWIIYPDGSNNSDNLGDLDVYFSSLTDVFDVLDGAAIGQEQRDRLTQFWYATRMLKRLGPYWIDRWAPAYRDEAIAAVHRLTSERIPARLDAGLPPVLTRRAALLRAGDRAGIVAQAGADRGVHLRTDDVTTRWEAGCLTIAVRGTLVDGEGAPLRLVARDDAVYLVDDEARRFDIAPYLGEGDVRLFLRRPKTGVEWYVDAPLPLRPVERDGALVLEASGAFSFDPTDAAFGSPLDAGRWVVSLHARALGYASRTRLVAPAPGPALVDGVAVRTRTDDEGCLFVGVGSAAGALADAGASLRVTGRGHRTRLVSVLHRMHVRHPERAALGFRVGEDDVRVTMISGRPLGVEAMLHLPAGRYPMRLTLGAATGPSLGTVYVGHGWGRVTTRAPLRVRAAARLRRRTAP